MLETLTEEDLVAVWQMPGFFPTSEASRAAYVMVVSVDWEALADCGVCVCEWWLALLQARTELASALCTTMGAMSRVWGEDLASIETKMTRTAAASAV